MIKAFKRCLAALTAGLAVAAFTLPAVPDMTEQASAADNIVAFPGAVGGGKYATGGRGGEVYHVTNLNDSGAGSFRDAVSKSGRIVVFDVSGTIELKSNIVCQSNITIAGQTAPGGSGITLKNYKLGMGGDNIICRFISSRPGPYAATSSGNDAWGGAKGSNSVIDHCSMGWTTDEQWALYSNNEYYTVQYSVIGPADSWGGHSKGIHGFGIMMGKGYCTFDHNLIVHNVSRNFRGKVVGTATADFTNNVIYNWAYQTAYGTIGHVNYVNNTLKMGNGTTGAKYYINVDSSTSPENFSIYMTGNRMLNKDNTVYDAVTTDNWNGGVKVKDGLGITVDSVRSNSPFQTMVNGVNVSTATTAESAADSYDHVLSYAGNGIAPDLRTSIDQQSANECRTGTGYHSGTATYDEATSDEKAKIDSYKIQCGVVYDYPDPVLQKTITDNDNDGMDDEWEEARGLNPNDPSDTNGDYCGMGYTNIEYYINDLTVDSFPPGVVELSPETAQLVTTSAFTQIEAESFSAQSGIQIEDCPDGGQNIGFVESGDYLQFKRIDFEDGAKSFTARVSGNAAAMELYVDSMSTPVATCQFAGTSGFSEYTDVSFNIPAITGVHNLYIKFTGGEGYLLNMNWFTFGKDAIPQNGRLITNLLINDPTYGTSWILTDNLQLGSLVFGDRPVVFAALPDAVLGGEYIRTACDAKAFVGDAATFTAAEDITVYVGLDARITAIPAWLSAWTLTSETAANDNNVTFNLYTKSVKAGENVTLGGNENSYQCVNYTVFAVPAAETPTETTTEPATTEPPTTEPPATESTTTEPPVTETTVPAEPETTPAPTTAEPTTTEPVGEEMYGNVNLDDTVSIVDVIMLNKAVLGVETLNAQQKINADVNLDGECSAEDSLIILKHLVDLVTTLPIR